MIIRKARKEDFQEYLKLKRKEHDDYSKIINEKIKNLGRSIIKKDFDEFLSSKKNIIIIVEADDGLIGYIHGEFYNNFKIGYISDIFVLKEFRQKGIATKLIESFIKFLKKRKYKILKLDVNMKNKNAIKIYKNWGFRPESIGMTKKIA